MKKFISFVLAFSLILCAYPMGAFVLAEGEFLIKNAEFLDSSNVKINTMDSQNLSKSDLSLSASVDYGEYVPVTEGWTLKNNVLTFENPLEEGTMLLIEGNGNAKGTVTATFGKKLFPSVLLFNDSRVTYFGNTSKQENVAYLNEAESSLEFVFSGSGFSVYGPIGNTFGSFDVYVDGILADSVDCYAAQQTAETELYHSNKLPFALHRVTVMKNRKQNENVTDSNAVVGFTKATIETVREHSGESLSLNGQWNIIKGGTTETANAELSGYNFASAEPILVPGNIWEAYPGYTGTVWYGKIFNDFLESDDSERVYLRFEAVQYSCDVYLNGVKLGSHTGSEIPFEFDVTDVVIPGKDNFLSVAVTNCTGMLLASTNTSTAAFWDCGGIWQEVSLNVRKCAYISDIYAVSDWQTGDVDLQINDNNNSSQETTSHNRPLVETEEDEYAETYTPEFQSTNVNWDGPDGYTIVYNKDFIPGG